MSAIGKEHEQTNKMKEGLTKPKHFSSVNILSKGNSMKILECSTHFPSRNLFNAGCDTTFQTAEAVPQQKHDEGSCHLSVMIHCYHKHIPYSISLM
jgi:hypothetical protein